jgi:hypothetical protein
VRMMSIGLCEYGRLPGDCHDRCEARLAGIHHVSPRADGHSGTYFDRFRGFVRFFVGFLCLTDRSLISLGLTEGTFSVSFGLLAYLLIRQKGCLFPWDVLKDKGKSLAVANAKPG